MSTRLLFARDDQGITANAPAISQDKFSATIAATTDTTLTVPSNFQNWVAFLSVEPAKNVWFTVNATAAAPVGATFASTTSELLTTNTQLPTARYVQAGDVLHFFSQSGTANVGVALYAITK